MLKAVKFWTPLIISFPLSLEKKTKKKNPEKLTVFYFGSENKSISRECPCSKMRERLSSTQLSRPKCMFIQLVGIPVPQDGSGVVMIGDVPVPPWLALSWKPYPTQKTAHFSSAHRYYTFKLAAGDIATEFTLQKKMDMIPDKHIHICTCGYSEWTYVTHQTVVALHACEPARLRVSKSLCCFCLLLSSTDL